MTGDEAITLLFRCECGRMYNGRYDVLRQDNRVQGVQVKSDPCLCGGPHKIPWAEIVATTR